MSRATLLVLLALVPSAPALTAPTGSGAPFVVHEWGTFTSVAGRDGTAMDWRPLSGPSDLPEFVYDTSSPGIRDVMREQVTKGSTARIRMETPVLYFYSDIEREVSVSIDFPEGHVTEWYPRAVSVDRGIDWGTFKLVPDLDLAFPHDGSKSHYYPARETAATPLQVCDQRGDEHEKYLFYRGIGDFDVPFDVTLDGSVVDVRAEEASDIGSIVVFEARDGKVGFTRANVRGARARLDRPSLTRDVDGVVSALEELLVARGLYADEARAMTNTWRDSWFEDGLRVFYLTPGAEVDAVLPLHVSPTPDEVVRVLVGRIEVITPHLSHAVREALEAAFAKSEDPVDAAGALQQEHGRFAEPVLRRLLDQSPSPQRRARIEAVLDSIDAAAAEVSGH